MRSTKKPQRQAMQNEKATGFWSRLLSEKAFALKRILGILYVFEKEVRWLHRHCVASGLLQFLLSLWAWA